VNEVARAQAGTAGARDAEAPAADQPGDDRPRPVRVWARLGVLVVVVVAVDQLTKALVRSGIERDERVDVFFFVEFVNVRNRGVAFGLLAGGQAWVLAFITVAVLALMVLFAVQAGRRPGIWLPVGLLIGGAAGNAVDRLREGAVTDFVDVPLWPAFNLADVAITLGVLALLYVLEGPRRGARA
jgi:signal peptidase II